MDVLTEMFSYTFLVRAFIVGVLVSICASVLGVSLVLKRYSMIGDGLSHVGFGALAIAMALNAAPLAVSIPVVILASFILLRISGNSNIKGDAAIALISTGALATGVLVVSYTTGMNIDICNYLFGSILAMSKSDVWLSVILAIMVLAIFVIFYNRIFAVTFDEDFLNATEGNSGKYNMLLAILTAVVIVLGMRMMGALLISGLLIFPALTSMRVFKTYKTVTICAVIVSLTCFSIGIVSSYVYSTPTGASIVIVNVICFFLFWIAGNLKKTGRIKVVVIIILALTISVCTACDGTEDSEKNEGVMNISEKLFVQQMNELYLNPDDYLGMTIKYEGIFAFNLANEGTDQTDTVYYVFRYGPGCCGYDANVGLEIEYNGEYPEYNDWVQVSGILKSREVDGERYVYLDVDELKVLDKRGAETVTN